MKKIQQLKASTGGFSSAGFKQRMFVRLGFSSTLHTVM